MLLLFFLIHRSFRWSGGKSLGEEKQLSLADHSHYTVHTLHAIYTIDYLHYTLFTLTTRYSNYTLFTLLAFHTLRTIRITYYSHYKLFTPTTCYSHTAHCSHCTLPNVHTILAVLFTLLVLAWAVITSQTCHTFWCYRDRVNRNNLRPSGFALASRTTPGIEDVTTGAVDRTHWSTVLSRNRLWTCNDCETS